MATSTFPQVQRATKLNIALVDLLLLALVTEFIMVVVLLSLLDWILPVVGWVGNGSGAGFFCTSRNATFIRSVVSFMRFKPGNRSKGCVD